MTEPRVPKLDRFLGASTPLTPPLFQSSVYTLPDLDALDRIMNGEETGFTYARDGHPNAKWLGEELAAIEGASWGVVCGSGMAAITAGLLALVQKGDRIVAEFITILDEYVDSHYAAREEVTVKA